MIRSPGSFRFKSAPADFQFPLRRTTPRRVFFHIASFCVAASSPSLLLNQSSLVSVYRAPKPKTSIHPAGHWKYKSVRNTLANRLVYSLKWVMSTISTRFNSCAFSLNSTSFSCSRGNGTMCTTCTSSPSGSSSPPSRKSVSSREHFRLIQMVPVFNLMKPLSKYLPDSSLLIIVGLALGYILHQTTLSGATLDSHTFFLYLLPPIIFDAGTLLIHFIFVTTLFFQVTSCQIELYSKTSTLFLYFL